MKSSKKDGFTLIEILAVLSIIIVVMGLAVGLVAVVSLKTTEARAHKDVSAIGEALETLRLELGRYPAQPNTNTYTLPLSVQRVVKIEYTDYTDSEGAKVRKYLDPWGNEYRYVSDGKFDVTYGSLGRDRQPGIEGIDDDGDTKKDDQDVDELGYGDDITNKSQ